MREFKDVWSWTCECGLEVHAGVSGYGDTDTVNVLHCPICARAVPTANRQVTWKDLNRDENNPCREVLSSSTGTLGSGTTMTEQDIKDAMAALDAAGISPRRGIDLKPEV